MIKFEVIVSDTETIVGDFKIPPGQRALKISFDAYDDLPESHGLNVMENDEAGGTIYIFGTKLAALERMLRESKRRGNDDG